LYDDTNPQHLEYRAYWRGVGEQITAANLQDTSRSPEAMSQSVSRTVHLANAQRPSKTLCGEARETGLIRRPVHTQVSRVTCRDCLGISEKGRTDG
jgi:hypothetical protein